MSVRMSSRCWPVVDLGRRNLPSPSDSLRRPINFFDEPCGSFVTAETSRRLRALDIRIEPAFCLTGAFVCLGGSVNRGGVPGSEPASTWSSPMLDRGTSGCSTLVKRLPSVGGDFSLAYKCDAAGEREEAYLSRDGTFAVKSRAEASEEPEVPEYIDVGDLLVACDTLGAGAGKLVMCKCCSCFGKYWSSWD